MSTSRLSATDLVRNALAAGTAIPGFNIPYLPMMAPVVQALRDADSFGLVMVARLEWVKFESGGVGPIAAEYEKLGDDAYTRLHLDHVPVIDEDNERVDYETDIREALDLGYDSVMIDGSRLPLDENIAVTAAICELAHGYGVPVEAELGAVMGHEAGPLPPYDELFESGRGFTDAGEARRFVEETGVDWLSVAVGSVHGAISATKRHEKKVEARLSIERIREIRETTDVPLVLHGGTGIRKEYIQEGIANGIAKINVATAIRQPYEREKDRGIRKAQQAVYDAMRALLRDELEIEGNAPLVRGTAPGA
jgi:ketose-bisphosphate aldolase